MTADIVWRGKACVGDALTPPQDLGSHSPSCWHMGCHGLTAESLQEPSSALESFFTHITPTSQGQLASSAQLIWGCRDLASLPQYKTILRGHAGFGDPHETGWGRCVTASQLSFSLWPIQLPSALHSYYTKVIPQSNFCVHTCMSESVAQGTWPKSASPWREYMICNLKDEKEPAMQKTNERAEAKSLMQRESFWIPRKRKEVNIAVLPKFQQPG